MSDQNLSHAAFSDRLRICVKAVGSIGRLGESAGLHRNTLNGYLKSVEPDRATLIRIAQAAGKSPEWLATGNKAFEPDNAEQSESPTNTTSALPVGFAERLGTLIAHAGGIDSFSDTTGIGQPRLRQLLAGADIAGSELLAICSSTKTPVSWLFFNTGFDHADKIYAEMAAKHLVQKMELIEESRVKGFKPMAPAKGAWSDSLLRSIFTLWEKIFETLRPAKYEVFQITDNLMAPTLEPNDLAIVLVESEPTKPGIYLFRKDKTDYFVRGLTAGDATTLSFDNPQYDKAAAARLLSPAAGTQCIGRVIAVFGPPH